MRLDYECLGLLSWCSECGYSLQERIWVLQLGHHATLLCHPCLRRLRDRLNDPLLDSAPTKIVLEEDLKDLA